MDYAFNAVTTPAQFLGQFSGFFETRWLSVGCGWKPRLAQRMFEKSQAGERGLRIRRVAAISMRVSEVCTLYSVLVVLAGWACCASLPQKAEIVSKNSELNRSRWIGFLTHCG